MLILYRVISLLIGYLLGNFESGYFLGKMKGVDLRTMGSGNIGTTNTLRNLGVVYGALTLVLDALKAIIAGCIPMLLFSSRVDNIFDLRLLMLYGAFGAVLGHDFCFFLKFKGGKGIASSFGMILLCFLPTVPLCVLTFVIAVALTRYVSLGSILAAVCFAVTMVIFMAMGLLPYFGHRAEVMVIGLIASALAVYLHRSNIDRLIHHKENKFTFHPKTVDTKDKKNEN